MRISLDKQEIGLILINWAKDKYHTHNVSVETLTDKEAMLFVNPQETEFSPATDKIIQQNFNKLQEKNLALSIQQQNEFDRDHSSNIIEQISELI